MEIDWSEHYIKQGDPNEPTYYIIRRIDPNVGLFSNYIVFAGHIRYALSKGYIPVVDMQNYPNNYLPPELLGKENAWEYYFCQPCGVNLEYALKGNNVIIGTARPLNALTLNGDVFNNSNILKEWHMLVKLGHLRIQPKLYEDIMTTYNKLFSPNDKVLGVKLRGTDYIVQRPAGHPIPPPLEMALSVVVAKFQQWKCNKIFLSTEDESFIPPFKQIFGDACVLFDKDFIGDNYDPRMAVSRSHSDRENDNFLRGKEYLTEMVILSKCNSLVTAQTSGAVGVMVMSGGFENLYVFKLGRYNVVTPQEFMD